MWTQSTRPGIPVQRGNATDCRHSRLGFHALFHPIAQRRDISPVAKLVHQALVSMHRMGASWTQTEIGETVGLSRHQVWRAVDELVAAGWLKTRRVGLGRPNEYELIGIDADDLSGRASGCRPPASTGAGRSGQGTRVPIGREERTKKSRYPEPARTVSELLETRYGPLSRLRR